LRNRRRGCSSDTRARARPFRMLSPSRNCCCITHGCIARAVTVGAAAREAWRVKRSRSPDWLQPESCAWKLWDARICTGSTWRRRHLADAACSCSTSCCRVSTPLRAGIFVTSRDPAALERLAARVLVMRDGRIVRAGPLASLLEERVLEVILDAPPPEPPPGFRVTAAGIEAPLAGRTVEAALALCRAHRLPVRATRVRVKSLEEVVLETHPSLTSLDFP